MPNVVLTSAVRANLLQLQRNDRDQGVVQNRLATGLRVSSALDDPRNFFQAQNFNNRGNDLARLQDRMGLAINTIQAADKGIKAMTKVAESMIGLARQARDESDGAAVNRLGEQFNELRTQLQSIAKDSGFNGVNLLGGDELEVTFGTETADASALTVNKQPPGDDATNIDYTGDDFSISITDGTGDDIAWTSEDGDDVTVSAEDIDASITELQGFINGLRTDAATLGTNLTLIQVRQDFTKDMINTLKAGADSLTLADENEEAANLLALQTRQQLSQQALALATQSQQSILRLLG